MEVTSWNIEFLSELVHREEAREIDFCLSTATKARFIRLCM
jgi:hypothetical protein